MTKFYKYYFTMSKLLVLMMDKEYPFTCQPSAHYPTENIIVRQTLSTPKHNRNTILAKANFVKNLKNKYLVKVQSLLEEAEAIQVMYEYVQSKLQNILESASTLLINKIYAQLNEFGRYLSNIGVRMLFSLERMGFTPKQNLKFFMGLDFEWQQDPDEQYLQQFYSKQVEGLIGPYIKHKTTHQALPSISGGSIEKMEKLNNRKISYSTLPSRYNRFYKIDEKLKQIKSTPKIAAEDQNKRKQSSVPTIPKQRSYNLYREQQTLVLKRVQDRKYSGDIKLDMKSKSKLIEKQNDIKSQYGHNKKLEAPDMRNEDIVRSMNSDAQTSKTKSKMQQMKEKEYKQISSMKKQYLKDFISVLQEQQDQVMAANPQHESPKDSSILKIKRTFSQSVQMQATTDQLQLMAKQAIQHSIRVMQKFRTLLYES